MSSQKEYLIEKYKKFIDSKKIYFNYLIDYQTFSSSVLKHTRSILLDKNASFNFERKGNSREGALTQKYLNKRIAGIPILLKVVKIRKDVDFSSQLHTYFHELAHLVNNHEDQSSNKISLSTPQKEYVAEVVSQTLLFSFAGGLKVEELPSNNKWEQSLYISNWIKNAKFSEEKIKEMWKQINYAYDYISKIILENTIKKTQD